MKRYRSVKVQWSETGERLVIVEPMADDRGYLFSKPMILTNPWEEVRALVEANFHCYLTEDEKEALFVEEAARRTMEGQPAWGSW